MTRHVDLAVIGGGISGLAAAWQARRQGATAAVLEADDRPGGKLQASPLAGVDVDESADAFLARVPEAVELCAELGIDTDLVAPGAGSAYVWLDGALRRLPADQLMGVPTDLDALAASGLLSPDGIERARRDLVAPDDRPAAGADESVGALVRRRLGDEVLDRLVAPLVGSVYAGVCDRMSVQVTAAQLAAARDLDPDEPSLVRASARLRARGVDTGKPVFLAPRGGVGRLAQALGDALADDVRCGVEASGLAPEGTRWRVSTSISAEDLVADAVVLATPAFVTAKLLTPIAPEAAAFLAGIEHASVALLALAVPRDGIDHPMDGSGYLVPRGAGLLLTACSWATTKWPHLDVDPSMALLRASAGHDGDDRGLRLSDEDLVTGLLADLRTTMGLRAEPAEVRVSRWPRSFPQPRPGHLAAVTDASAALTRTAPRIAMTGAWARGVGVPACIREARAATSRVLAATTEP
jgi:oxygen-dependent protoporphyrinogen oxidase